MYKPLSLRQIEAFEKRLEKASRLKDSELDKKTGVGLINSIKGPLNRLPVTEELEPLNQPRRWDEMTVQQKRESILDLYEAVREKVNEMREEENERNLYLAQRKGPWYYQMLRSRNATVVAIVIGFVLFTMVAILVILFRTL